MSHQCELCLRPRSTRELHRSCGLAICDDCMNGAFEHATHRLGFSFHSSRSSRVVRTGETSTTYHYLDITAKVSMNGHALEGRFKRESQMIGAGLLRGLADAIGLGDPKVGDPLFDDFVKIRADPAGPMMGMLIARPGIQDAIMELLSNDSASEVFIGTDKLHAQVVQANTPPNDTDTVRAMLAIAAHIQKNEGQARDLW